jgi:hypothetical protein
MLKPPIDLFSSQRRRCSPNMQHPLMEVDVLPLQPEQLAQPQAGKEGTAEAGALQRRLRRPSIGRYGLPMPTRPTPVRASSRPRCL